MSSVNVTVLEGMVTTLRKMREGVTPKTNQNREYLMYCVAISAINYCVKAQLIRTPVRKLAKKL